MPKAVIGDTAINFTKFGNWETGQTPVVFVHGLAASSAFWYNVAQQLPPEWPVLIYDLRGHGRSRQTAAGYTAPKMSEDLLGFLDSLAIDQIFLIGHSFGGSVALHFTLNQPSRVLALTLVDTRLRCFQPILTPALWPSWQKHKDQFQALGFTMSDDEPDAGMRLLTELARFQIADAANSESTLPEWMNAFLGQRQSLFSARRWIELVQETSILAEVTDESWLDISALQRIRQPILGIYGADSPILASGKQLKFLLPQLNFRMVEKAGHFFPASRPEEVSIPLTDFLKTA